MIRYRTTPESADENQRLIEGVYAELATAAPVLRYSSFRLADGVTFVHVVDGAGLPELAAFQEFQRELDSRLAGDVAREEATLIGSYAAATATNRG
ncbi:hypothetical protein [Streptomyces sp. H39-S7]|uniref:hypothetical protein n=1 Tax=Streptomyces sp. H39-S7 TaxID=3004357 RepID=UPI0022AEE3E8|nr:hypothetical protein [Streptomyces sp. H39-S7]MCZ4120353.1 hypothetical protein [Streptomyces sp. H39-S7]